MIPELNNARVRLKGEEFIKRLPDLSGSSIANDLGNKVVRKRGDQGTENHLVSLAPGKKSRVRG